MLQFHFCKYNQQNAKTYTASIVPTGNENHIIKIIDVDWTAAAGPAVLWGVDPDHVELVLLLQHFPYY